MKRQRNTTHMKKQTKNTRSQNKWRWNRQTTWKRIQKNDSKDNQKPENKMEKMQESINKDLELKNKHTETTQLLKLKIF